MGEIVSIRVTLQRGAQIGYEGEVLVSLDETAERTTGWSAERTTFRLLPDEANLHALDLSQPEAYGQALWKFLFGKPEAQAALLRGVEQAWNRHVPVRLQLHLQESAHELGHLAWELLRTPHGSWLVCSQGILFSRYLPLHTRSWYAPGGIIPGNPYGALLDAAGTPVMMAGPQPVYTPPPSLTDKGHTPLALAVVSCPEGNRFGLPALDIDHELDAARAAIPGARVETLAACPGEPVTLERLIERLYRGWAGRPYDILYLACYTRANQGFPGLALLFEPEAGRDALIQEDELAQHLAGLPPRARPRLLALASCDLPGGEPPVKDKSVLTERALFGQALTQAGIPAVLVLPNAPNGASAAQCEDARKILPVFFAELFKDGLPDRALAVARKQAAGDQDWWRPVLFVHGPSLPL